MKKNWVGEKRPIFWWSSWTEKVTSRTELKILQLELWLEPARLGLIVGHIWLLFDPSNLMIPNFPHIIKIRLAPLKFLYYEEYLVSSNLNSKLIWFHSVRPNVSTHKHFLAFIFLNFINFFIPSSTFLYRVQPPGNSFGGKFSLQDDV